MLYATLPKIKNYHTSIDIDESYAEMDKYYEQDAAVVIDGYGNGAIYSMYYDGKNENSCIYKIDTTGIYYDTHKYYEVDFSDDNWKDKLIDTMIECAEEWWKKTE